MTSLKNKDFLKLLDFTPEEIAYLLELAAELNYLGVSRQELETLIEEAYES